MRTHSPTLPGPTDFLLVNKHLLVPRTFYYLIRLEGCFLLFLHDHVLLLHLSHSSFPPNVTTRLSLRIIYSSFTPISSLDSIKPAYSKMPRAASHSPQHLYTYIQLAILLRQENKWNTYPARHCHSSPMSGLLGSLDEYCFMHPPAMQLC